MSEKIGIVTGAVSQNLEVLDFDNKRSDATDIFNQFRNNPEIKSILDKLPIEETPGGGFHVFYRCNKIEGNQKLAQFEIEANGKLKVETLIETRGEGGFIVCAPSSGYDLIQGSFDNIPLITEEERERLINNARAFNTFFKAVVDNKYPDKKYGEETPWTQYNNSPEALEEAKQLLLSSGWSLISKRGDTEYWTRPGKSSGVSATFRGRIFYVFSSNSYPFEDNKGYTPFAIYTILNYGSSKEHFKKAIKDITKKGYGKALDRKKIGDEALYIIRNEGDSYGYTYLSGNGEHSCDITNFTITLSSRIIYEKDGKLQSYFTGHVQFAHGEIIIFERLDTEDFVDTRKFEVFLTNLCGTKVMFYDPSTQKKRLVIEAIKYFNQGVSIIEAVEFGYDSSISSYMTGEIKITKESITESIAPIKYTEAPQLGLSIIDSDELKIISNNIIEKFID